MCFCNFLHFGYLQICYIFLTHISLRSLWRTKRHKSDRLDVVCHQVIKDFFLLEADMHLRFTCCRHNLHQWKYCLHFRNGHIGNSDMTDQSFFHQLFALPVCIHKLFHRKWFGIWISGIHITSRCMIIREWPVDKEQINVVALQILNTLSAGLLHFLMHIIPYFCHDK